MSEEYTAEQHVGNMRQIIALLVGELKKIQPDNPVAHEAIHYLRAHDLRAILLNGICQTNNLTMLEGQGDE